MYLFSQIIIIFFKFIYTYIEMLHVIIHLLTYHSKLYMKHLLLFLSIYSFIIYNLFVTSFYIIQIVYSLYYTQKSNF